jgi:hypothetical protein
MNFQPKTEKELREAQLASAGEYQFEVLEASDQISKRSQLPMIKIKIGIYNGESMRWHVTDYLTTSMESKLRHFCDTAGLLAKYESGTLTAADCMGRSGKCKLVIEEDEQGTYPDKNSVKDYISRPAKPITGPIKPAPLAHVPDPDDSDVPFS